MFLKYYGTKIESLFYVHKFENAFFNTQEYKVVFYKASEGGRVVTLCLLLSYLLMLITRRIRRDNTLSPMFHRHLRHQKSYLLDKLKSRRFL